MHRLCHLGRVVACGGSNWCLRRPDELRRTSRPNGSATPVTAVVTWEVEENARAFPAVRARTWPYPRSGRSGVRRECCGGRKPSRQSVTVRGLYDGGLAPYAAVSAPFRRGVGESSSPLRTPPRGVSSRPEEGGGAPGRAPPGP